MGSYQFKFKPFKHQLEAMKLSWGKQNYALFCEMGTGKSKILIDTVGAKFRQGLIDAALIIAPKGVYKNWELSEIPTHLPDDLLAETDVVAWSPSQTKRQIDALKRSLERHSGKLKIVVMNIEALSTEKGSDFAEQFVKQHRTLMAIDESTTIKNRTAKRTKNAMMIGRFAKFRRIMTGSPVTKSPMDLYSQCAFLGDECLGFKSYFTFQNRYAIIQRRVMGAHSFNQVVGYQNLDELSSRLDSFSYRVLKKDCLDLPEKVYLKRVVELTPAQRQVYDQVRDNAVALLDQGGLMTAQNVLTQILRLQQICSGVVTDDDGNVSTIPTNKLSELLEVLEEADGKVIIWAVFVQDILEIQKALAKEYGPETVKTYYGATPADERQNIVREFQDPNSPLRFFVGQSRTGGYGLTLTEATTVIYYSNSYDLEVRLQSEDRAHRIGQKNSVTYIDIVAEKTVDERVLAALRAKIDIAAQVLSEDVKQWLT